jgi:hypothetical protein
VKPDFSLAGPYTSKTVGFKFRGTELRFALSQGLFSSAGVDRGTALLLKALSKVWDEEKAAGAPPPRHILDAGCGAGIIAVCAAAALGDLSGGDAAPGAGAVGTGGPGFHVRAQDRDDLARLFTGYNARLNGLPPGVPEAHTEALLSGPPDASWDLILSNIPAKAGRPVLEDFVSRSLGLLSEGGKVLLVAVQTLGDFFRSRVDQAGGVVFREEAGSGHIVFGYSRRAGGAGTPRRAEPVRAGENFLESNPFYLRRRLTYELEGITLSMDTVHGAPDFDRPGGAAEAAAKLARRLNLAARIAPGTPALFHEPGQGWFPAWLRAAREETGGGKPPDSPAPPWVLSGRNILALEAARRNIRGGLLCGAGKPLADPPELLVAPAADLALYRDKPRETPASAEAAGGFGFIAAFPEAVPRVDRTSACWESFAALLEPGGIVLAGLPSPEAERLDRKKTAPFTRLGELRRNGFRALAYQRR